MKEIHEEYKKGFIVGLAKKWGHNKTVSNLKTMIKEAKEAKIDLDAPVGKNGESFLTNIFNNSYKNYPSLIIELMEELVKTGANINFQDAEGNSLLHYMASSRESKSHQDLLEKFLSDKNLDLNLQNLEGQTPFQLAISKGNDFAAEYFHSRINSNLSFEEAESKFFSGEDQNFFVLGVKIVEPLNSLINILENWELQ